MGKCLRSEDALRGPGDEPWGCHYSSGSWRLGWERKRGCWGQLGNACYRHRWVTVLVWVAGVACLIGLWTRFGAAAQNDFTGNDPGQTLLNEHFAPQSGDTLTLAIRSDAGITSAAVRARVASALVPFRQAAGVTGVTDPYTVPGHVSADGHIAYATVQFDVPGSSISNTEALALMHDATAASGGGVTFSLGGDVVDQAETPYGGPSNGVGVGAAAIVLLIAFGSLLAMGLPLATALMGIGSGLALIALLGHVFPAPSFSAIVAALIGLGVGVDYALFIVTRFRSELQAGAQPQDAVVKAMRTAGRAVLTAGTTVVIGMLGLLVLRQPLLNGVSIAAAATVAMTVLAALTLLPALLSFTGTRLARASRLNTFLGDRVFGRGRGRGRGPGLSGAGDRGGRERQGDRGGRERQGDRGGRERRDGAAGRAPRGAVGRCGAAAPGAGRRVVRSVHPAAGRARAGHEAVLPR